MVHVLHEFAYINKLWGTVQHDVDEFMSNQLMLCLLLETSWSSPGIFACYKVKMRYMLWWRQMLLN